MAGGTAFKDQTNPKPVFQVGQAGDVGSVEISDLIFETLGPQPGAIMVEWNVAESNQGSAGMWDVHFRIGGTAGTQLQSNTCSKNPTVTAPANTACEGAFLLLHVTQKATIYLENNWFWVADHELDLGMYTVPQTMMIGANNIEGDHNQINIFNGRGVLIESDVGPVWLYGTSSEHSVLYNYQISNASNVYMALIQTETPYFQSNPDATTPFTANSKYQDPIFSGSGSNNKAWGLRIVDSDDIFVYGAGLYSFFVSLSVPLSIVF
jgi:glucan 1,3-beta-glucosidase